MLKGLDALHAEFRARQSYWAKTRMPQEVHNQLDRVLMRAAQFWDVVDTRFVPAAKRRDDAEMRKVHMRYLTPLYNQQHAEVDRLVLMSRAYSKRELTKDNWYVALCLSLAALIGLAVIAAVQLAARLTRTHIIEPLDATSRTIG